MRFAYAGIMRHYILSVIVTVLALVLAAVWGGAEGLAICALLIVMEVSFSFDNAVVNATVLKSMDAKWQRRFLTWGMLVAVFGMYYLFPILIVAIATGLGVVEVTRLAFDAPAEYTRHLMASHVQIGAFGGMFLLMVFFKFIFDKGKTVHWLGMLERKLTQFGKLGAVESILALLLLLLLQSCLPEGERLHAMTAGVLGVVLYVATSSLMALLKMKESQLAMASPGLMGFIYLNILDASFSLDAVVGSFAISKDIVIIMLGLSAGAMFVRSMTVHLVRTGTLARYVYLEHGAYYGIFALAIIMLVGMMQPVPGIITGLVGVSFVLLSLWSSVKYNRRRLSR
jgi:uncharacterized protein